MPGTLSSPAMRRVAEHCDAWHPLGLSLDMLAQGIDLIRAQADRFGRRNAVGFAPRNTLQCTGSAPGSSRAAFTGSPADIAADVQRAQAPGCSYVTFDLPEPEVSGMVRAMERFMREVKPVVH